MISLTEISGYTDIIESFVNSIIENVKKICGSNSICRMINNDDSVEFMDIKYDVMIVSSKFIVMDIVTSGIDYDILEQSLKGYCKALNISYVVLLTLISKFAAEYQSTDIILVSERLLEKFIDDIVNV